MPNAHENEQTSLFAAVDALLEEAAAQDALPHPDERKRLREAAGLSQDQIAQALAVRRETVTSWETGRTAPAPRNAPPTPASSTAWQTSTALTPLTPPPHPGPRPLTPPQALTPLTPRRPRTAGCRP